MRERKGSFVNLASIVAQQYMQVTEINFQQGWRKGTLPSEREHFGAISRICHMRPKSIRNVCGSFLLWHFPDLDEVREMRRGGARWFQGWLAVAETFALADER